MSHCYCKTHYYTNRKYFIPHILDISHISLQFKINLVFIYSILIICKRLFADFRSVPLLTVSI